MNENTLIKNTGESNLTMELTGKMKPVTLPLENTFLKEFDDLHMEDSFFIEEDICAATGEFVNLNNISYDTLFLTCFYILLVKLRQSDSIPIWKVSKINNATESTGTIHNGFMTIPIQLTIHNNTSIRDIVNTFSPPVFSLESNSAGYISEEYTIPDNEYQKHIGYCYIDNASPAEEKREETTVYKASEELMKFKFGLLCIKENNRLKLTSYHRKNCFPFGFNELMINRFRNLLKNIIQAPEINFNNLNILPEKEKLDIINNYFQGESSRIDERCFHQIFEEQAEKNPDNIAVIYNNEKLTYRELNEKSNQLAGYLDSIIDEKESLIGICMERSIEFLISIIGILKAGCAYIPLDPDTLNPGRSGFPQKRLLFMLDDTKVKVLISKKNIMEKIPATDVNIICLDSDWNSLISSFQKENLNKNMTNKNLAYGIYTSGSTGKPKAVLVEHASIINLFESLNKKVFKDLKNLKLSLNAPLGFDASVQQLIGLLKGYCISIIPEDVRNSGKVLLQHLKEHRIQLFDCTPSQLQLLIDDGLLESNDNTLKIILVGGEAVSNEMWNKIINSNHHINFYNVYGPTECTVDAAMCPITREYSQTPLIGKPIANNLIYILDQDMKLVPIGVEGELYISGNGVSRGYLNREELTKERFLPNPFHASGESLMYRTGDIGYFQLDGNIAYISRIDNQIKIRSHRIELGEIESVLKQHPSVKDALAILNSDSNIKKIIAYIILKKLPQPKTDEYITFLQEYLPIYMLPANYVFVDSWPLTKNGKIDIKKLPAISSNRPNLSTAYIKPETKIEKEISNIFQSVLEINTIGIDDDFVSLGGDSMTAISVLTQIYKDYDVDIDFADFFQKPTIRELVKIINKS